MFVLDFPENWLGYLFNISWQNFLVGTATPGVISNSSLIIFSSSAVHFCRLPPVCFFATSASRRDNASLAQVTNTGGDVRVPAVVVFAA